ncbi:MAG: IgGFc-binding protein, partial [Caldilineaceae bacterium]|nr:IgGFc-binding protein [Caldilineaceae bacterium]
MVKQIMQRWHRPFTRQSTELLVALWFALLGTLWITQPANAAPPPPVQHFYVPLPEDQIFHALQKIYPGNTVCPAFGENPVNPINTYISISALSDNTIIYYDHWEDGFEIDVTRPQQATTQIWGDGNPANGIPPGIPSDIIMADTVIVLDNAVDTNTLATVIDFDGGDRVSASNMIAMTRAAWATGSSTLLAGAVEVYDTNSWGTTYEVPVGENVDYNQIFEHSSVSVMAAQDDTELYVDFDGDGADDGYTVIDQGRAYHIDGDLIPNGDIGAGTKIRATGPIQVSLITGDVCSNYESRWYALFPNERWSSSYYNPVGTPAGDGTTVFLYNPTTNPLTIQCATTAGVQTPIVVSPRGVSHLVAPNGSGSHFYTENGTPFMAVAAIDSDQPATANTKADWGFTLVPERMLTQQIMVGWGPG